MPASIPIYNFVDITSSVGANGGLPTRNYGAMIITGNPLVPTGQIISFTSAAAVGSYFGTGSEEYARAVAYFSFISKNGSAAQMLSFWFWNQDAATTDLIFGAPPIDTLTQFNAITTGDFTLSMGGYSHHLTGVSFSAAGSLAAVATDLTNAIQAITAGGTPWTSAVVSYDSTTGAFNLVSGEAEADTISITAGTIEDMAGPLGWLNPATVISNGTAAQTLTNNVIALAALSNNFGSITATFALDLTLTEVEAIANWNASLTPNIQFIYSVNVTPSNASAWSAALANIQGTTLTLQSPGGQAAIEFPEMVPMILFAATQYSQPNSVQNYKYQGNFNLTPSVTSESGYTTYTGLNINFYGNTQNAGQTINFYMDGVMMGPSSAPQYQNLYANEIWFKDNLATALINLLLLLPQIPANPTGVAQITATIQSVINLALTNGTISVGKTLNSTQKLYISDVTGSNNAWQQVQNQGYWLNVVIESSIVDSQTIYTAVYTLVYSKDDVVQSITGSNILI